MQKTKANSNKQIATKPLSQKELKKLRLAEARHHYEMLQEAKILHEHLAEFWDESLDHRRPRQATDMHLYPAELETNVGTAEIKGTAQWHEQTENTPSTMPTYYSKAQVIPLKNEIIDTHTMR